MILSIDNTEVTDASSSRPRSPRLDKAKPVSVLVRRGEWVNFCDPPDPLTSGTADAR